MKPITFITGNKKKLEQIRIHLDYPVEHVGLDLEEIQSLDPVKIIEHKAKEAYNKIKKPVLVEDISLTFHALGKLPGPLIKWFLQELKTEGLCRLLDSYQDKSATASVIFGYYDGTILETFDAKKAGTIADHPRGDHSFGWNPIFIPDGYDKTWGEMDMEEQKETSMRRIALKKLEAYLKQHEK